MNLRCKIEYRALVVPQPKHDMPNMLVNRQFGVSLSKMSLGIIIMMAIMLAMIVSLIGCMSAVIAFIVIVKT